MNIKNFVVCKKYTKNDYFFTILAIFLTFLLFFDLFINIFQLNKINIDFVQAYSKSSMCVLDSSGRILFANNENEKKANASTTKIVTLITALEHIDDLEKIITVPDEAVGVEGSSIYLKKDEQVRIIDLMYGLMLRSGNDSAVTIALEVCDSLDEFAILMNETALKAGAKNSNFTNPHGLDNSSHYTTAYDLCKITMYALSNPIFKQIVSTKSYVMGETNKTSTRYFKNKNKLLFNLDGCIGVKTGFTTKAGRCLVSAKQLEDRVVVCSVLNCPPMFETSKNMLEKSFDEFKLLPILSKDELLLKSGEYFKSEEDFYYPMTNDEKDDIKYIYTTDENGENIVKVYFKNDLIKSSKLYKINTIDALDEDSFNKSVKLQWEEGYEN